MASAMYVYLLYVGCEVVLTSVAGPGIEERDACCLLAQHSVSRPSPDTFISPSQARALQCSSNSIAQIPLSRPCDPAFNFFLLC